MKYIDEFRDGTFARQLSRAIASSMQLGRTYRLMEFCGGHTHAIHRYGLQDLLPAQVQLIHGPGYPVCVLPMARVDHAIELAKRPEVILCIYADVMRVPGSPQDKAAQALVAAMREHPLEKEAAIIGEAVADPHCFVEMETEMGGRRIVDWLTGKQLPRIC